jgi:hypothetical protein
MMLRLENWAEIPQLDRTRRQMMKRLSTRLFILAILFLISFARPMQAQAAASASKVAARFSYDSTQEVTLSGTVVSVRTKGAPGMMAVRIFYLKVNLVWWTQVWGGLVWPATAQFPSPAAKRSKLRV